MLERLEILIFKQRDFLCGQSPETSDEGLQNEVDVWVVVHHLGLHLRSSLKRDRGEKELFFRRCSTCLRYGFDCDISLSELDFSTQTSVR